MPQDRNIPPWPSPNMWPKPSQGGSIDRPPPTLAAVKQWIATVYNVPANRVELIKIFAIKPWLVTALLQVDKQEEVIFKAGRLELFAMKANTYVLLQRCYSQAVPEVIAHQNGANGTWILFKKIIGDSVQDLGRVELLPQMAVVLAEIQVAFAELSQRQVAAISRFQTDHIPDMLLMLIQRIEDYYLPFWKTTGGAILKQGNKERLIEIPENFIARLQANLTQVTTWVEELKASGWPETIWHTDLHPGNAILGADGNMRLIDWDQAVIGLPFASVYWLDSMSTDDEWGGNPPKISVKDAYLKRIPWNNRADRLRAWELGERLADLLGAYEYELRSDALKRRSRSGGSVAMLLLNSLQQWESIDE